MHFKIPTNLPNWRSYKVEDVPELMWTRKALQIHGLKDPWLRNEVWKYTCYDANNRTPQQRCFNIATTGFKYGLILALISTAITKMLEHRKHEQLARERGEHGGAHH